MNEDELFAVWMTCATLSVFLAGYIGHTRDRSWFSVILGACFGPLGVIAAACLLPSPKAEARYQLAVERAHNAILFQDRLGREDRERGLLRKQQKKQEKDREKREAEPIPRPAVVSVPCPSCGELVRIPAGANSAKCPTCKSLVRSSQPE